ncbi:hypothetical protein L2E82_39155 [Cichorium intybus]|uniref:Uncharacterized protein n=1 Tax=Cichorium intybus TaxID=13427 RepID=A0ACB9AHR8_CICIN|nr:hypothetical protein L2E82_39155 [Cichorium intybus]
MAEVVVSLQALVELQTRFENSTEPSGIAGFTWKIHKYLVPTTNQNADITLIGHSKGKMPHQHDEPMVTRLKCFTDYELEQAIKKFGTREYLHRESYKGVYKGWIDKTICSGSEVGTGLMLVIKKIELHKSVTLLDLEVLTEFSHPNLEKLIGYCLKDECLFLVYEFLPKGNFKYLLESGSVEQLPLVEKVKIAVGIARGIVFLHNTQEKVCGYPLYRNNILLDKDFTAKLSEYDVTKLVDGGYPKSMQDLNDLEIVGPFQPITNLLGFTVVLAELLTGQLITKLHEFEEIGCLHIHDGNMSLVDIACKCFNICNEEDSESRMLRILERYHVKTINNNNNKEQYWEEIPKNHPCLNLSLHE